MRDKTRFFTADFETTVFDKQEETEVWAAAMVELGTEEVEVFNSIDAWWDYVISFNTNTEIYFHNLKFDGEFILYFLLTRGGYKQAFHAVDESTASGDFAQKKYLNHKELIYSISDRGMWYRIIIKNHNNYIEIRDSLKILPESVENLGKSFGTKHKKLSIDYVGFRYAGGIITEQEKSYISNDVLVPKEALEIMRSQGHTKLTIGSCCLEEFKKSCYFDKEIYKRYFPNLYSIDIDPDYEAETIGEYIKRSYHGGWCYLVPSKANKLKQNGTTADVNSLYPSMMHSESGNKFPIGLPTFWRGDFIPEKATDKGHYYFVRIKTEFKIKPGKLPCIQIKNSAGLYPGTEWLRTSDIYDKNTGLYHRTRRTENGDIIPTYVILTLTETDYQLIKEHYHLINCEILDGCYFDAKIGLFDVYIDKYKKIKMESKGAVRTIAKLFLNNLYGKMASTTDSSFKVAYLKDDGSLGYYTVHKNDKEPGYIPIGSAITSYARNFTIRAAQANYYGPNKSGFIYADTDSIHCDLKPEEIKGIKVDDNAFCCWKLESCWDYGIFVRQKSYIEHITHENLKPIARAYLNIKCAGMPDKCKKLFELTLDKDNAERIKDCAIFRGKILKEYGQIGLDFVSSKHHTLKDFKVGLVIPTGKLLPKHMKGGIVLTDSAYRMRENVRL